MSFFTHQNCTLLDFYALKCTWRHLKSSNIFRQYAWKGDPLSHSPSPNYVRYLQFSPSVRPTVCVPIFLILWNDHWGQLYIAMVGFWVSKLNWMISSRSAWWLSCAYDYRYENVIIIMSDALFLRDSCWACSHQCTATAVHARVGECLSWMQHAWYIPDSVHFRCCSLTLDDKSNWVGDPLRRMMNPRWQQEHLNSGRTNTNTSVLRVTAGT